MRSFAVLLVLALAGAVRPAPPQGGRKAVLAEYARRYRAIDKKDADQLLELADWCKANRLTTYANLLYRKVVKLEPQNDEANAALGKQKFDGVWYEPDEARELRAKRAAARRRAAAAAAARAKVDRLVRPGEDESRSRVEGELRANDAEARELGDAFADATGTPRAKYCAGISGHVILVAHAPPEFRDYLCQIGEYVYRKLDWITTGTEDAGAFADYGGKIAFYLANDPALETGLAFIQKRHPTLAQWNDVAQEAKDIRKYELEFTTFYAPPVHVHLDTENQASAVANVMAHSWLQHVTKPWYREIDIRRGRPKAFSMMAWMLEGAGIWASLDAIGRNRLYRIQKPKYANQKMVEKDVDVDYTGIAYEIATTGRSEDRSARSFYQLCRARMNMWHVLDLAMSFALVDYLVRARLDDWRGLVAKLGTARTYRAAFIEQFGTEEEQARALSALARTDDGALEQTYRAAADRFESAWKAWVAKTYEDLRDEPDRFRRAAPFGRPPSVKKR